jgi:hypothetical protein
MSLLGRTSMRAAFFALLATALVACGERDRDPNVTPREAGVADSGFDAGASDAIAGDDGRFDAGFDSGPPGDSGFQEDADQADAIIFDAIPTTFNDAGCLTFGGAQTFCGTNSNDRICQMAVDCSLSTDLSQCQINCEMGTMIECYGFNDVACVQMALSANNCTQLAGCGWIF